VKRSVLEQRLAENQERITASEVRVEFQRQLIATLEARGLDCQEAKRLLEQLEWARSLRSQSRDRLKEALTFIPVCCRDID
jgi:hypothetical protein